MGIDVSKVDVRKMLEDNSFMDKVVKETVADPKILEGLAEDLADEISEVIEDDPRYTQSIIAAAKKDAGFKRMVVKALTEELVDD